MESDYGFDPSYYDLLAFNMTVKGCDSVMPDYDIDPSFHHRPPLNFQYDCKRSRQSDYVQMSLLIFLLTEISCRRLFSARRGP